jgi:signal transduction histidine kinase
MHAVDGGRAGEPVDPRVAAVLEVLGGEATADVASRWRVETAVLHRWVRDFVDAGTAQVTNRPTPEVAHHRDRFLAAFAEEVRSPLTVALGWVQLLVDGDVPPARTASTLERLLEALVRLNDRTLDVELMTTASLGRLPVEARWLTVGELVAGVPGAGEADVRGEGPDVPVHLDPALFRRVLRDLWEAAATPPEPRERWLEVRTDPPWVELRVVRAADPIRVEVLRSLFEPFELGGEADGVRIRQYLARALTVAHGGTVGVDQDEDGAVLWVKVPARPSAPPTLHRE